MVDSGRGYIYTADTTDTANECIADCGSRHQCSGGNNVKTTTGSCSPVTVSDLLNTMDDDLDSFYAENVSSSLISSSNGRSTLLGGGANDHRHTSNDHLNEVSTTMDEENFDHDGVSTLEEATSSSDESDEEEKGCISSPVDVTQHCQLSELFLNHHQHGEEDDCEHYVDHCCDGGGDNYHGHYQLCPTHDSIDALTKFRTLSISDSTDMMDRLLETVTATRMSTLSSSCEQDHNTYTITR
jgi:hypothetical protein